MSSTTSNPTVWPVTALADPPVLSNNRVICFWLEGVQKALVRVAFTETLL
jgi:hypothetical protein